MNIGIEAISYSGATVLSLILGSHTECTSIGHAYIFWAKSKKAKEIRKRGGCYICELLDKSCSLMKVKNCLPSYDNIRNEVGGKHLIDSSTRSDWFRSMRPDRLVWVFRDPIGLASSYKKRGLSLALMCEAYVRKYSHAVETVEYRNVIKDTPELRRLFDRFGLEFKPEYLEYWNYDNHMIGGNTGVLIKIAEHRRPDKLQEIINQVSRENEQYKEYYQNRFNGNINILTPDEEKYVTERCQKIYKKLKDSTI